MNCSLMLMLIYVTVGMDKPLARLIVVLRLSVDKGKVLRSGILDTPFSLCVLLLKDGLTQELKIVYFPHTLSPKLRSLATTLYFLFHFFHQQSMT